MLKFVLAALAAISLASFDSAGAAGKPKRQKVDDAPTLSTPVETTPVKPEVTETPGPPWAKPGECYTDEGYGRYWPCGAGRAN
jgi:hypothetical protein